MERYPEATLYNKLINMEWQGAEGEVKACGGDAMYRVAPLARVKVFNESMIAGEEGDLCLRLRAWGSLLIVLISHDFHDANMHHFTEWWLRCGPLRPRLRPWL